MIKNFLRKYSAVFVILIFLILTRFTCIIKLITGLPCPSCGMTRAYLSLLHLNIKDAWNYHPLFWFIPPVILFIIISEKPLFHDKKKQALFLIAVFFIIFSVYSYRMIKLFPNIPPMDYNKNSLIYTFYERLSLLIIE